LKNLELTLLIVLAISSIGIVSVYATVVSPILDGQVINATENQTFALDLIINDGGKLIVSNGTTLTLVNGMSLGTVNGLDAEVTINTGSSISGAGALITQVNSIMTIDGLFQINGIIVNNGIINVRCGVLDTIASPILVNDQIFIECTEEGYTGEFEFNNLQVLDFDGLGQTHFLQVNHIMNLTGTTIIDDTIVAWHGNVTNFGNIILQSTFGGTGGKIKLFGDLTNVCENIDGRGIETITGSIVGGGLPVINTVCAIPVVTLVGVTPDIEVVSGTYNELGATCFSDDEGQIDGRVVIGGDTVDTDTIGIYDVDYDCADSNVNPVPASTVTRMVAVVDTTMPLLVLNGESVVVLEAGVDTYTELDGMCFDLLDGEIDVVISGDTVDDNTVGTYVVDYDCEDANSNSASTIQRTVSVEDTIPPVITVSQEQSIMILEGTVFDKFEFVTCFDSFDGDLTNSMITVGTVNTLSRTVQEVIYLCQDGELNNDDVTVSYAINKISTSSLGSSVTTTPFGQKVIPKLSDIPTLSVTDSTQQEPQTISDLFANLFSNRININTDDRIDFAEIVNDRVQGIRDTSLGETSDIIQKTTSPIVDFFRNLFAEFFN